jgi:hypothetical protein
MINWEHAKEHMETRWARHPGDTNIKLDWAKEAFNDKHALVQSPDPASKSGQTERKIGYSNTAGFLITIIYMQDPDRDDYIEPQTAWKSNSSDTMRYWRNREETNSGN